MDPSSQSSAGLSPELVLRFTTALERWKKTSIESGVNAATTPSGGIPGGAVSSSNGLTALAKGLEDLDDRLIYLAHAERGPDACPIDVYTTTSGEHGEVFSATSGFVAYMRRKFPGYGECVSRHIPAPSRKDPPVGGSEGPKQPRYQRKAP